MLNRQIRTWMWTALSAGVVALAGCAHPQLIDMGQDENSVLAELGEPQARTPMEDGTVRWTYSTQPFGQEVWWLFFDAQGRVVNRVQGLQEKYFSMVKIGRWTEKDVWALWGKCAEKYTFHLVGQHAWMYRYRDIGGFDMAVWPQFDKDGVVRSMDITTDPWRDRDADPGFE